MQKKKIVVYAICKNEEKFVERWIKSMSEADEICVLDTGSTDQTVNLLKKFGAKVKIKKITPWRFDIARNESLKLVPEDADICVCTDLDEVFIPGWRETLEQIWTADTTRLRYNYNWALDDNNKPKVNFYLDKIHARKHYKWTHPVHEVLESNREQKIITTDDITLNHYPDSTKSRSAYLPLLELSVKEDPNDDRNMHYLGREYMYYGKWNESIDTLIRHLNLPSAVWKDERCASMRFIAKCYMALKRYDEAAMWLDKAMKEAPHLRDPFIDRSLLAYQMRDWINVEKYCLRALDIKNHPKTYINEITSWDETVYDLLSISSFYLGHYHEAIKWVDIALEYKPDDERLKSNKKLYEQYI